MLGHRELTIEDYAEILKRRIWLILASALLFLGIGLSISFLIPPRYVSQTLVLIEQQKVPEDYVKPVVNEDLNARLASMKEQILSRSRIEPIIDRFNLYSGSKYTMDDRLDLTRKAIGINPIPAGPSSHGMPGFYITFQAQDAHTAQQVCGEITSLFVSANLSARQESAEGTTDFLKQQLGDAKRNLDEQDAKLAGFEQKYLGKLPDQEPSNMNALQAMTTQLDASTQALSRMQQEETFLQAMVAQQEQEQTSAGASPATEAGAAPDSLSSQLKAAVAQEKDLESLYTPDYPDVVSIKRRVASLRAEVARNAAEPAKGKPSTARTESPQLQQLRAQLRAEREAIVTARQEQGHIEQQVRNYEARIDASPRVEEEYKKITRDHETALQFYNTLLTKMNESSMATALEQRQQGEQFRVMDAPNLPDSPTFPKHGIFAGGGLAAGLFLGLLLAGLLEYRDTSVRNESDIWAFTKLPTLAVVSYVNILAPPRAASERRRLFSRPAKSMEGAGG
jgi:polysaccharide chain length determinant protein (PEP-CTERM system associated)